uniref:Uncharacterized protein n=1 Tax=viral metagenome TaxID=1070528 RepID=A0A6M3IKX0_9ZZZZ
MSILPEWQEKMEKKDEIIERLGRLETEVVVILALVGGLLAVIAWVMFSLWGR